MKQPRFFIISIEILKHIPQVTANAVDVNLNEVVL